MQFVKIKKGNTVKRVSEFTWDKMKKRLKDGKLDGWEFDSYVHVNSQNKLVEGKQPLQERKHAYIPAEVKSMGVASSENGVAKPKAGESTAVPEPPKPTHVLKKDLTITEFSETIPADEILFSGTMESCESFLEVNKPTAPPPPAIPATSEADANAANTATQPPAPAPVPDPAGVNTQPPPAQTTKPVIKKGGSK